ncbi:hypothetical protein DM01DRAFT_1332170 [Hesseltinella vesiculosa]|uniref:EamA domain-containing protein n=1 Tax=Hesseltinella vesiculosa TaxID=101127 RepID=A0A1X2GU96_9FUNG|nr:hypothetical protein DM01DRAFT_1332170 [Hesseltinella vesiculosa]
MSFFTAAVLSGCFAALSSVFAKLFTDERTAAYVNVVAHYYSQYDWFAPKDISMPLFIVRATCFILVFACNSLMWTLFTKALNKAPSSIQVTIVNGAANLATSAILGHVVFQEPLSLRWWAGASLMLTGTILISRGQAKDTKDKKE